MAKKVVVGKENGIGGKVGGTGRRRKSERVRAKEDWGADTDQTHTDGSC